MSGRPHEAQCTGLIHGYVITDAGVESRFFVQLGPHATNPTTMFVIAYALGAGLLVLLDLISRTAPAESSDDSADHEPQT